MQQSSFIEVEFEFQLRKLDRTFDEELFVNISLSGRVNPDSIVKSIPFRRSQETVTHLVSFYNNITHVFPSTDAFLNESLFMQIGGKRRVTEGRARMCFEPLAEGIIKLADIKSTTEQKVMKIIMPLLDPSDESGDKSRGECVITGRQFKYGIVLDKDLPARISADVYQNYSDISSDFMESTYFLKLRSMVPSEDECRSVHVPNWPTVFGLIPATIYSCYKPRHKIDESFMAYIMKISLESTTNSKMDTTQFVHLIKLQLYNHTDYYLGGTTAFVLKIIVQAAALFANACDYISDLSKNKPAERFIDVQETLAGDCEDLGKHIQVVLSLIKEQRDSMKSELLKMISEFLNYYEIVLTVACVTSASASSMSDMTAHAKATAKPTTTEQHATVLIMPTKKEEYMCHIYTTLLSQQKIYTLLQNGLQLLIAQQYTEHTDIAFQEKVIRAYEALIRKQTGRDIKNPHPFEQYLPTLVGEGTNFVNPLLDLVARYAANQTEQTALIQKLQEKNTFEQTVFSSEPVLQKNLTSQAQQTHIDKIPGRPSQFCSFYRKKNEIWIDFGEDSLGCLPFAMLDSNGRYGVWFKHVIEHKQTSNLALVPMYEMDPHLKESCYDLLNHMSPMRTLTFGTERTPDKLRAEIRLRYPVEFQRLDSVLAQTSIYNQPVMMTTSADISVIQHALVNEHIVLWTNDVFNITEQVKDALINLVKVHKVVPMGGISYKLYPLSDDGALYLIEIRISPSQKTFIKK